MTIDVVAVLMAFAGFDCFVALGVARYRHRNGYYNSRLLLVDVLLAIAAFEIVADRLSHLTSDGSTWRIVWQIASAVCQGAIVAGGVALVMSYQRGR